MQLVTNYMKNITKSVAYAAADVSKEQLTPNIANFTDSNKDFLKSTYAALKNPKTAIKKAAIAFKDSKVFQALDYGAKNTLEDLRTGKFYNKEREDRDQLKLAGLDADGWNDLSEFGVEDDWESNIGKTNKTDEITTGDLQIVGAIESSNAAAANATVNAIIASGNHAVQNSRVSTSLMYQQNERLFGGLHTDISTLNTTMDAMFKVTSSTLQNIDKNTSGFFTESLKLDTERNAMIKELLEMERNKYKSALDREKEAQSKSKKKVRWSDINSDGLPDFEAYFDAIKTNVSNQIQNSIGFSGMGEDSNMLATFMISPLKFIPQAIVKGVIPSTVKLAVQEIDKTISGVFGQVIGKLGNARANGDNGILGLLAKFFGINSGVNRNIDNSKYEKGAVPFDGITRKAIIDVIPTHLRRIEAALTGSEEMMYDYNAGRWIRPKDVRKQYEDIKKSSVKNATNDLRQDMDKYRKRIASSKFEDNEDFDKALDEFQLFLYENNGVFNPNVSAEKNGIDFRYRYLKKYYKPIVEIFNNFDVAVNKSGKKFHTKNSARFVAKHVLEAKDREEKMYRDIESDPANIIYQLMGSPDANKHLSEIKSNGKGTGKFKIAHNMLLDTKDKLDNNIFDYLQMTVKELQWQRLNANMIGGSGYSTGGSYNGKPISIDDIRLEAKNTTNSSYIRRDNESLKSIVKKIESGEVIDLAWMDQDEQQMLLALSNAIQNDSMKEYDDYVKEVVEGSGAFGKWMDKNFWKTGIRTKEDLNKLIESKSKDNDSEDKEEKGPNFFKKAMDKISKFTEAPAEIFTNILYSADRAIYEMFFKMEIDDDEKGKYNGFMDFLAGKAEKTFDKLKDNINKNILDPIKKKFGIDDEFKNKFKESLSDDLSSIGNFFINSNKDVYNEIKGFIKSPKEISEKAKTDARRKVSSNIDKMLTTTNLLDDDYRSILRNYGFNPLEFTSKEEADKALEPLIYKSLLDKSEYTTKFDDEAELKKFFKAIRLLPEEQRMKYLENAAEAVSKFHNNTSFKLEGKDLEEITSNFEKRRLALFNAPIDEDQNVDRGMFGGSWLDGMATGTMGRPFSGNTMLSKGELLFNEDGVSRVKKTDAYRLDKPTHILNSVDSSILMGEKPTSTIAKDLANENSIKNRILSNHADGTTTLQLNGQNVDMKPYVEEAKKFAPEALAGGAIGGIASTLFGLVGGPLLGAGIGAATGLIMKSDFIKEKLFGKLGEDGNREGGVINKTIIDTVKQYAPNILKYGAAGLIPGLLTPLGPIGGLLVGGTIGFLKSNEKLSGKLYGDTDNILGLNEKTKKVLRDMIPGAGKGAAVGAIASVLFGGPFGLLGNAALGAGVGIMTSTDEFKDGILGKEINGVRMGGALGAFKQALEPLAKAGAEIRDKLFDILDKNIVNPLKRFLTPTIHAIPQFAGFLVRKMNEKLEEKFLNPLSNMLKDKFIQPLAKITGSILKPLITWPAKILTSPFKLLGIAGDAIKKKQLKTHNADYMTAEERNQARLDLEMDEDKLDTALANIGKEGGLSVGDARNLRNNVLSIVDNTKDVTKAKKGSEKNINSIIDNYTTEDGKSLDYKTKDKVRKALYRGDVKAAQKILTGTKLNGTNRTLTEKEAKDLLNGKDSKSGMSLSDYMKQYTDLHNREKQAKYMTKETKNSAKSSVVELMGQLGYDTSKGISNHELVKFAKMLDTEITRAEANPDDIGKDMALETEQTGYLRELVEKTGELKDFVKVLVTGNTDFIKKYNDVKANDIESAQQDIFNVYGGRKQQFKDQIGEEEYEKLSEEDIDITTSGTARKFRRKATKQNDVLKHIKNGNINPSEIGSTNGGANLNRVGHIKALGYRLDNSAIKFITKCTKVAYNNIKSVLKNKYVKKMAEGRAITVDDVKLVASMASGKPEFCRRCKILSQAGKTSADYKTFEAIVKESATTILILKSNTQTSKIIDEATAEKETADTNEKENLPGNFLGTIFGIGKSIISGIGSLFSGGDKSEDSEKDNSKLKGAAAALSSITSSAASSTNTDASGNLDETDKQGDNKDKIVAGDGTVLTVKKGSDGSVDHDLSDPTTKKFFNIKNKKDAIVEKLQNAQLAASEKINTIFEGVGKVKAKAKKGIGILGGLLFGGLLWKSGILTKLWDNAIVPLWKNRISPFINDKVLPWVSNTLSDVGDWVINTGIPKLGEWLTENLPGLIWSGIKGIGSGIGSLASGIYNGLTGNDNNSGTSNTGNTEDVSDGVLLYDSEGNAVDFDKAEVGVEYKNSNGDTITVNEDGTYNIKDGSSPYGNYIEDIDGPVLKTFLKSSIKGKSNFKLLESISKSGTKSFKNAGKNLAKGHFIRAAGNSISGTLKKAISDPVLAANKAGGKVNSLIKDQQVKSKLKNAAKAAENGTDMIPKDTTIDRKVNSTGSYVDDAADKASKQIDDIISNDGKKAAKETAENASKQIDDIVTQNAKNTAKETTENAGKNIVKETGEEFAEEAIQNATGSAVSKTSKYAEKIKSIKSYIDDFVDALFSTEIVRKKFSDIANSFKWKNIKAKFTGLKSKLKSVVGKQVTEVAEKAVKEGMEESAEKLAQESVEQVAKNVAKETAEQGVKKSTKSGAVAAAKNAIGSIPIAGWMIDVAFAIVDFAIGWDTAESILAISDPTLLESFAAATVNAMQNIPYGIGILLSFFINIIAKCIVNTLDDMAGEDFVEKQRKTKQITDLINKKMGTNYTSTEALENSKSNWGQFKRSASTGWTTFKETASDFFSGDFNIFENWNNHWWDNAGKEALDEVTMKRAYEMQNEGKSEEEIEAFLDKANKYNPIIIYYCKKNGKEIDEAFEDFKKMDKSEFKKLKDEYENSKLSGESGKGKYGRGYAKQIDPAIASLRFNNRSDSEYQTIGDSGCGPAAAVNAVKFAYGRGAGSEVVNAAKYALSRGYKEVDGGTRPEFFNDYFAHNGLNSQTTRNRNQMANNIANGLPTVLMGVDPNGVSSSTPYGKYPHYVTVTGVDSNGNAIVQDPESRYDNQLYNLNTLLNKSSLGISAGIGARGRSLRNIGRTRRNIRHGRGGNADAVALQAWNFLRANGFSEESTAGLLGNFQQESSMDPTNVSYGVAGGLFQMETYGDYNTRWGAMAKHAESKGKQWTDLQSQLEFLIMEMPSQLDEFTGRKPHVFPNGETAWWPEKVSINEFKALKSIETATEIFERVYERASKPMMDKRISYAKDYYSKFTGTQVDSSLGMSDASSSNTEEQKETTIYSIIGDGFSNFLAQTKAGQALTQLTSLVSKKTNETTNTTNNNGAVGGDAQAFIDAAAEDIGYKETGDNITKFGEWYGMNGQPWCAMFVSHAANKAGISTDVIPKFAYCPTGYDWFKSRGQTVSGSEAKAGDVVFFNNGERMYHTGIVEDVSNGEIHTIEGNSSDMVKRRSYKPSDSKLYFGRPKFANTASSNAANVAGNVGSSLYAAKAGNAGKFADVSDAPDIANTRGGNCCKPASKYGAFKNNLSGRGSSRTNNASVAAMNSNLINTGRSINIKTKSGSFNRVEDTSGTGSYGRGNNIDYSKLLNVIITTLVTIADNTDKLNAVVEILNEKLGLDIKTQGNPESLKSKLKKVLLNNKDTSLDTYLDTMNSQSMYSIINAMNAIASE